jgi:hypothetical protein
MSNDEYNPRSIDAMLSSIDSNVQLLLKHKNDHERRISFLENWRWAVVGAGAAVSWLVSHLTTKGTS